MPEDFTVYRRKTYPTIAPRKHFEPHRGSARDRGYDARWDKISRDHRRRHPFCIMCEQEGRDIPCDAVDHIVPIDDGGPKYSPDNRWSICTHHHNGLKRRLERYARRTRQMNRLRLWCLDPAARPQHLRV